MHRSTISILGGRLWSAVVASLLACVTSASILSIASSNLRAQEAALGQASLTQAPSLPDEEVPDEKVPNEKPSDEKLIVVLGEPGSAEFAAEFEQWAVAWSELAKENGWALQIVQGEPRTSAKSAPQPTIETATPEQQLEPASEPAAESSGDASAVETSQEGASATTAEQVDAQETNGDEVTLEAARQSSRDQLQSALSQVDASVRRVWLVMIGHGTYTNGIARFNLSGPDVTPEELAQWVAGIKGELIVINCASASAPFLQALSKKGRIVVTATRSGSEFNYARFGKYLAESVRSLEADLDHDDSVSLLEAFLAASRKTNDFYVESSRLATEHALLDDNYDRVGTTHDFYRGVRPVKQPQGTGKIDGATAANRILFQSPDAIQLTAEQTRRREELEAQLLQLRTLKETLPSDSYYDQLEPILLEIARLYEAAGG